MNRLDSVNREYGLRINVQKTKVMITDRCRNNQPEIRNKAGYEVVSHYNYLGFVVTNSRGCEEEIRQRPTMAKLTTNYNNRLYSKIQKILNLLSLKHTFYNNGKLAAVSLSIPQ